MLKLGNTKNLVLLKKPLCQQKMFHIEVNVTKQSYESHKKICSGNKTTCDTQQKTHAD